MNLEEVKFARKIGIELTFVTEEVDIELDKNPYHRGWDQLTNCYKDVALLEKMPDANKIYSDPGCIEYPSPILGSWSQAQNWFEKATDIGKMLELTTTHPDQESGMGHIHVGCTYKEAAIITADSVARPYLTWIFATPMGSQYCKSTLRAMINESAISYPLVGDKIVYNKVEHKRIIIDSCGDRPYTISSYSSDPHLSTIDHNGIPQLYRTRWYDETIDYNLPHERFTGFSWRPGLGTIELRFFDSAEDWKQQVEHIAFTQRYVYKLLQNSKRFTPAPFAKGVTKQKHFKEMLSQYRNNIDLCISDFKDLIVNTLELPWARYERYIDKNLVPAFEYGRRQ